MLFFFDGSVGSGGSYLLDSYGADCVGAWSACRKLKSDATNAIKAYWNSGSNSQDIGFDGSGKTDTAALLSAVGSGSATIEMYDQSGNGRHLTSASFSTRPRLVNLGSLDTFGGFPAPVYAGAQTLEFGNWASTVGLSGNPNFCVFAVYAKTGSGHLFGWGDASVGLECVGLYDDGTTAVIAFSGGNSKPITAPSSSTLYQLTVSKTAGRIDNNTVVRRNGSSVTSAGGSSSSPAISAGNYPLSVGRWANNNAYRLTGHCLEFIVYDTTKSSDVAAIENNIRSFYGI